MRMRVVACEQSPDLQFNDFVQNCVAAASSTQMGGEHLQTIPVGGPGRVGAAVGQIIGQIITILQ